MRGEKVIYSQATLSYGQNLIAANAFSPSGYLVDNLMFNHIKWSLLTNGVTFSAWMSLNSRNGFKKRDNYWQKVKPDLITITWLSDGWHQQSQTWWRHIYSPLINSQRGIWSKSSTATQCFPQPTSELNVRCKIKRLMLIMDCKRCVPAHLNKKLKTRVTQFLAVSTRLTSIPASAHSKPADLNVGHALRDWVLSATIVIPLSLLQKQTWNAVRGPRGAGKK